MAEDNPQDCLLMTEAFLGAQISVEIDCVNDGDELLARLDNDGLQAYGMVILDVHLPRRSAEEVLTTLKTRSVAVPLIALTSLISREHKARLMALGVREVIAKPFDLNDYFELAKRLSALLELS